ncbi:TonB-dependent receptor plug domain-containing protein, partial [bacterium]|nr:TonB-dependent receptor plug domain-containing protein [bacterium]
MKLIGNIILIFLFLLVFAGAEVFAQDQDGDNSDNPPDQTETAENDDAQSEESNDIIDLGVIYIEGTYLETDEIIDRPTAFATVLDPQELSRRSITLPEVLDSVPGVSVRSFGGLGALSTISIRGLGSENVLVMLDGVPLNPAGGSVD